MRLAVKKEPGTINGIPGGGFHYLMHPIPMTSDAECAIFDLMGYVIINVLEETGKRLLGNAVSALKHQVEVAQFAEEALKK